MFRVRFPNFEITKAVGKDQFLVRRVKEDLKCMRETIWLSICFRQNRKIRKENKQNY